MPRRLPPLNAVRAFEAAARLGSFTAAAGELFVTHGAISRQVQALEAWTGVSIFDRVGRRVRLTEAGRSYLSAIQPALDGIAAATQRLAETTTERRLVVNALPTFTMRWLLPRLTQFQLRFPSVELRLVTSDRPLSPAIDEFDVAVRREPALLTGCRSAPFLAECEFPVCSPALLARAPLAKPEDLGGHTLLEADTRPQAWASWLKAAGLPVGIAGRRQRFDHFYLTLQAAVDGLGVALGSQPIVGADLASGRLIAPLATPAVASRSYCWIIPEHLADNALVNAFCAWLTEAGAAADASADSRADSGLRRLGR
jgi:LysR family glycine cleavage system transcriptional activator